MIEFRLEIKNPWSRDRFENLWHRHGSITKNKFWELEFTLCDSLLIDSCISYKEKTDHAGLEISLGILSYGIAFRILDSRHWDYEQNRWQSGE